MNRSLGVVLLVFGIVGSFAADPSLAGKDRLNIELLKTLDAKGSYTANNGLVIVNITDPANPTLARTVEIKGGITDVAVNDGFAFLAAKTNGVRVLNVSNPVNPVEVGRYTGCPASELAVLRIPQPDQNTSARARYYVYVAGGPASLLLFQAPVQETVVK